MVDGRWKSVDEDVFSEATPSVDEFVEEKRFELDVDAQDDTPAKCKVTLVVQESVLEADVCAWWQKL